MDRPLSQLEYDALARLERASGLLVSALDDTTGTDVFGQRVAGRTTYRRLEKAGYCLETEEDLLLPDAPELGTFTPTVELTERGRQAMAAHRARQEALSKAPPTVKRARP